MDHQMVTIAVTIIVTFVGSSGFWTYVSSRDKKKDALERIMLGLAYERMFELASRYIHRGHISKSELADLRKYLYEPYIELGGNGVMQRIMEDVMQLPIQGYQPEIPIRGANKNGRN